MGKNCNSSNLVIIVFALACGMVGTASALPINRVVYLLSGNDNFIGGAENDVVDGGLGNDVIDGGAGSDTVFYGTRSVKVTVQLKGASNSTVAVGQTEGDTVKNVENVVGGSAADSLTGDTLDNILEGGPGADVLKGNTGMDTASYSGAKSGVIASLSSPKSNTGVAKGDSYNSIENLEGSQLADTLIGNSGSNVIIGNKGADTMTGGTSSDIFICRSLEQSPVLGADKIMDFNAGTATSSVDRIDLSGIDTSGAVAGRQPFAFIGTASFSGIRGELRAYVVGTDTYIDGDADGDLNADFRIVLKNFSNLSNLTQADFVL